MSKKTIRINFTGLSIREEFNPYDNPITKILKKYYDVEICEDPDYVFCGVLYPGASFMHGVYHEYLLEYPCVRIMIEGENFIPDYNLVDYNKEHDCSLVAIKLETGRHHQIRIQFSSRGHYLLGDQRYGVQDNKQICLFSYYLSFTHPVSKEKLEFFELPPNISYWTFFTLSKYVSVIKHLHL